jgi:hypothetical protein
MNRQAFSFGKRAWLLRCVILVQIALVAYIGAVIRGTIDVGESAITGPSEPAWIEKLVGLIIAIVFYSFPLWGIVVAYWAGLREGRLVGIILLEGLLWLAAMIALLPGVQ